MAQADVFAPHVQNRHLPGTTTEFIDGLLTCETTNTGPYATVTKDLERNLLRGEVDIVDSPLMQEIAFKQNSRDFSLYESSSTVSELAPLVLYLKHVVGHNSLLIMEEPEAHLHPYNQVILARCIVRLVRMGLNILLTTHSPFILEELSHILESGRLTPEQRKSWTDLRDGNHLSVSETAVYAFEMGTNGTEIRHLDISAEDGIEQEEFVRVSMIQYDQLQRLRWWVDDTW